MPEVAAVSACPTFIQHIAGTVQRETQAGFTVIVGAHARDKPPDFLSLVTGQIPGHQDFGPRWPEANNRRYNISVQPR